MAIGPTEYIVELRASSKSARLHALLRERPRLEPDAVWEPGTRVRRGVANKDHGFNLCLGDGADRRVVDAAIRRLRALAPFVRSCRRVGTSFQLDIGVMPGDGCWMLETVLAPEQLSLLARLGVELCVSAYAFKEKRSKRGPAR